MKNPLFTYEDYDEPEEGPGPDNAGKVPVSPGSEGQPPLSPFAPPGVGGRPGASNSPSQGGGSFNGARTSEPLNPYATISVAPIPAAPPMEKGAHVTKLKSSSQQPRKSSGPSSASVYFLIGGMVFLFAVLLVVAYQATHQAPSPGLTENIPAKQENLSDIFVDPVTRQKVDPNKALTLELYGRFYYFGSQESLEMFRENPLQYVHPNVRINVDFEEKETQEGEASQDGADSSANGEAGTPYTGDGSAGQAAPFANPGAPSAGNAVNGQVPVQAPPNEDTSYNQVPPPEQAPAAAGSEGAGDFENPNNWTPPSGQSADEQVVPPGAGASSSDASGVPSGTSSGVSSDASSGSAAGNGQQGAPGWLPPE